MKVRDLDIDLKGYVHMKMVKEDKEYYFIMPLGREYEEALEVAQEIVNKLESIINNFQEE